MGYFCVAILVGNLARRSKRRCEIQETLAWGGALVALIGFAHMVLGLSQPFGLFGRDDLLFPSTLINPNHLAGFLGFTSFIAVGLAIEKRGLHRWRLVAIAVMGGSGVFLSLSRAGIIAYCIVGVIFALVWSLRAPKATVHFGVSVVTMIAIGALALVAAIGFRPIVYELWTLAGDSPLSKTEIWRTVPQLLADFPFLGIGRGAFESLAPKYFHSPLHSWTHLENEWLQALVDWGPFGGGFILLLGILTFFGL